MRVFRDGEILKGTKISGPYHNYLGLLFAAGGIPQEVKLEAVRLHSDEGRPEAVNAEELRAVVCAAVEEVNRERGAALCLQKIQYVPTDSPRFETYALLAKAIAEFKLCE
jgi:hypothetical protein